jgi:peptidoglycan/LPS O-acetylase OafA/YrhL
MAMPDNRVFGLDLMRAVAILSVVYAHGYGLLGYGDTDRVAGVSFVDGVTLFFVLSGFLIGRILLRTINRTDFDGRTLVQFWVRRWFRTLPNYVLMLSLLLIVTWLLGRSPPDDAISYYFFLQNIASPHPEFFGEAWSLSIEEWFYLCIPIPLYLSTKLKDVDRRRLMLYLMAAVILSVTLLRIYRAYRFDYSTVGEWNQALRTQVVTRLDSLMFGVLGAYLSLYHPQSWRRNATVAFVAGISLLVLDRLLRAGTAGLFYRDYFALSLTAIGAFLLLPKLSELRRGGGWIVGLVTFVSLISYSMYLLNYSVVESLLLPAVMTGVSRVCWRCSQSLVVSYVLFWTMTIAASFLLYRYFERPMTALREKWPARVHVSTPFAGAGVLPRPTDGPR